MPEAPPPPPVTPAAAPVPFKNGQQLSPKPAQSANRQATSVSSLRRDLLIPTSFSDLTSGLNGQMFK